MQKLQQFYIMKFNSSRLDKSNYNIKINIRQAKKNGELVSLGDNQVLRSIRKIKNKNVDFDYVNSLFQERRKLTRRRDSIENKERIIEIDKDIDNLLFIPEYISIKIEKDSHYKHIIKQGIVVNGKSYTRLLCGAGNARQNTVFFIQSDIYEDLDKILRNGMNTVPIVPAKHNAYYALSNSSTYSVSEPKVCVIPDCKFNMVKHVDWITEQSPKDIIEEKDVDLGFKVFDGMGLISPRMAEIWAEDLDLDYVPCCFVIRNYFVKGLVAEFDFHKFAKEIAKTNKIKDIYGVEYNIEEIDVILTESQFKLANAYDSWQSYLRNCQNNNSHWGCTKFTPKEDKTTTFLNYQYLQTEDLNEEYKIKSICEPTLKWLKNIIYKDSNYALLYLMGSLSSSQLQELDNVEFMKVFNNLDVTTRALILNREMINDIYIKNKLYRSLNRKIKDSYIGKLAVDGNYQFMLSDPYAFCEHAFNMPLHGLLNEFEHYSQYWNKRNKETIVAYRSPLTWRSEVNLLHCKKDTRTEEWYRYIYSGIIFNVWGCDCMLFADGDFDGDIIATTDNQTLIDNVYGGIPITYQTKTAQKKEVKFEDMWKADLAAFNSKVGFITNMSTSLYAMLVNYTEDSREYKEIMDRLKICRIEQGNTIDAAKGVEVAPIPKHWSQWENPNKENSMFTKEEIEFNNSILIEQRPYFMRYVYSKYNQEFKSHYERYNYLSIRQHGMEFKDLLKLQDYSDEQKSLIRNYNRFSPLLDSDCTMNNICHYMENQISELKINAKESTPVHVVYLMLNENIDVSEEDIREMEKAFKKYKKIKQSKKNIHIEKEEKDDNVVEYHEFKALDFNYISVDIQKLAHLAVYVNYILYPGSSKNFAWDIFGEGIILNIYDNTNKPYYMPFVDEYGDIEYLGSKYKNKEVNIIL